MIANLPLIMLSEDLSRGLSIAAVGMFIVAVALTLISLFIAALPRILTSLESVFPDHEETQAARIHPETSVKDDEAVVAAIGFVLHQEFQNQMAREQAGSQQK